MHEVVFKVATAKSLLALMFLGSKGLTSMFCPSLENITLDRVNEDLKKRVLPQARL